MPDAGLLVAASESAVGNVPYVPGFPGFRFSVPRFLPRARPRSGADGRAEFRGRLYADGRGGHRGAEWRCSRLGMFDATASVFNERPVCVTDYVCCSQQTRAAHPAFGNWGGVQTVAGAVVYRIVVYEQDFAVALVGGDSVSPLSIEVVQMQPTGVDILVLLEQIRHVRTHPASALPFGAAGALGVLGVFGLDLRNGDEMAEAANGRHRRRGG